MTYNLSVSATFTHIIYLVACRKWRQGREETNADLIIGDQSSSGDDVIRVLLSEQPRSPTENKTVP